jgi:excisionase family DNA binding protein
VHRDPETVRRWIRAGKLRSQKVGTQHLIDERDLDALVGGGDELPAPPQAWRTFPDGTPQPDWVRIVRRSREGH